VETGYVLALHYSSAGQIADRGLSSQNEAFIFYSDYTETQLLVPAGFLLESIAAPGFDEKFVYKKYSNKSEFRKLKSHQTLSY
jgi:hypothetical protein